MSRKNYCRDLPFKISRRFIREIIFIVTRQ